MGKERKNSHETSGTPEKRGGAEEQVSTDIPKDKEPSFNEEELRATIREALTGKKDWNKLRELVKDVKDEDLPAIQKLITEETAHAQDMKPPGMRLLTKLDIMFYALLTCAILYVIHNEYGIDMFYVFKLIFSPPDRKADEAAAYFNSVGQQGHDGAEL